jgi:hypothetical protein
MVGCLNASVCKIIILTKFPVNLLIVRQIFDRMTPCRRPHIIITTITTTITIIMRLARRTVLLKLCTGALA